MPNWCENFVTFSHDDLEKVKELKTAFEENNGLNYLNPMPKELENTTAPSEVLNWYTWRIDNWGTKWEPSPEYDVDINLAEKSLDLSFLSAWSPPIGVYEKAYEDGWTVFATFCEPAMDFIGTFEDGTEATYSLQEATDDLKKEYEWVYDDLEEEDDD